MAGRIKGITVEIGGDTTGLDKALKGVNSTIKTTQSSLKDVNKLLKLDPANTNLVTQKQKLLKDAVNATKEKLEALKTAQKRSKLLRSRQGSSWRTGRSARTSTMPCRGRSLRRRKSCDDCSRKRKRPAAYFRRLMKPEKSSRKLGTR